MQITIGGTTVSIIEGSLSIDDAIGERSTAAFVVRDSAGASHYQKGQPVEIRDSANNLIFAGVIDSAQEQQPGSGPLLLHTIRCADWHYLADKRIAAKAWENVSAGAIVRDLAQSYLAAEGVVYDADVSTGKEAGMSASSFYGPGYEPSNLVDGSTVFGGGTAYASGDGAALPQWVQIDLGEVRDLYRFRWINNRLAARLPGAYTIAVSTTGAFAGEETVVATVTGNTTWAAWVEHIFDAVPARYLRMTVTAIYSGSYFEFAEWQVFADGSVQEGPTIREAVVNYAPVTDALDGLAEKAGCIWWIDPAKRLHFVEKATYAAPWQATAADMRQGSVTVEHANPKYRNRQYIKGGRDVTDPQTETRKGDGNTRSFALGFPIAKVPTVQVNAVAQTVGIKGIDTGKDWYWSKGDPVLTQDQAATPLATTDTLSITYQGEYDIIVLSEDNAEIIGRQQIEGGGTGYVEDVADEPNTSNRDAAFQSANAKLRQYAKVGRRLKFRTWRNGLAPGQLLTVTLPEHALSSTQMLIESVSISNEGPLVWCDVTAVEGPEQGSWAQMFRAMATRGQAFVERVNIGEDQTLIILQTFTEAWPWGEAVTPRVFACPVPSVNLYPSAALLPC